MEIIIDASCIIAVLLGEEKAIEVKEKTKGTTLVSPFCLPYEIGNSLTACLKRCRINNEQAIFAYKQFEMIPIRFIEPDIKTAIQIAAEENCYAYDMFYVTCALDTGLSLYSLDNGLVNIAKKRGVKCL